MNMICAPCKNQRHDECPTREHVDPKTHVTFVPAKDKTWCDCQHKTPAIQSGQAIINKDTEILWRLKENDQ
jgi:hypothetical protein